MKKYISFVTGPNASGKGTLTKALSEKFGYYHFNGGNCLRDFAEKYHRTDIQELIDNGELVSDDVFEEVFHDKFHEINHNTKIIMDGAPRIYEQVSFIQKLATEHGYEPFWIIVLNAPLDVLLERVKDRVVAPDGNVYHMTLNPPPKQFKLSELHARKDDRQDIVKKRYEYYVTETLPCLTHPYLAKLPIHSIDATKPIPEVLEDASEFVKEIENSLIH